MLLKHVLLACQWTHVNLICRLYEISYKLVCKKFMSKKKLKKKRNCWTHVSHRIIVRLTYLFEVFNLKRAQQKK
jgi:hypothetical protein